MGELQIHKEKNTLDSIFGPIQDNALEKNKELNLQRSKSLPGAPGSLLGDANKIKPNATVENLPVKLPPAQAKKAAPGQALLQVAPAVKVKKSLGAKVRAFFHLQSKTDKAKQRVGEDNAALRMMAAEAQRVLSSFNPDKEISSYSIFRRKKMYYRKKDCREQALALNKDYLAESARKTIDAGKLKTVNPKSFAKKLKGMMDCRINFMSFKNDENFLKHYTESMEEMSSYAAFAPLLMKMTQKDIDTLNKTSKLKLPKIGEIRQTALAYTFSMEWYAAKLFQMKNKHYLYLKDTDTASMKTEELEKQEKKARIKGDRELADYLKSCVQMRKAEGLGAVHIGDDRSKWRSWGNSGRTAHKWGVELFSAKSSFKYPPKKIFTDKKELGKYILDLDITTKYMLLAKFQLKEKDIQEGKSQKWTSLEAQDVLDTLVEIKKDLIKTDVKLKGLKGRYKLKKGAFNFDANASVGAVSAQGSIGAGLSAGQKWYAKAQIAGSASAAALQSRVKMGLNWDNFGINVKGQGKLATASAEGFVGVGKMKFKDYDGNKYEATGVGAMATAQAALVEAEASGGFTIFGIKIGASLSVQAGGVGGTIGGFANSSGIGASFGALLGLGFRLNISVNWSGFLKWREERKKKKELKKERIQEMKNRMKAAPNPQPVPASP